MKAWEHLLSELEGEFGVPVVAEWLRPLKIVRFDAANLILAASDPMQIAWFEEHVRPKIRKRGFFNENHRPIKIHFEGMGAKQQSSASIPSSFNFRPDPLDPDCTLEDFVLSAGNTIAYKLFSEWAATSSCPFNPIFLYGPKGSGKTHLLMGAANSLTLAHKKCLFVTAATFTEHVVQAIRASRMQEFRKIYRETDVLMIDNIDQFGGRAATQEEFFHTFNNLHTLGKQIVLSSLSTPSKLVDIESRLISRFEWGIAIGMEKVEGKKILERKAERWKIPLSSELIDFLLEKCPSDPITALQALALRGPSGKTISTDLAKKLLADLIQKEEGKAFTPEKIVKALSSHFGIKATDLIGKSQARECAFPRQIAMFLCRELLKMPFQAIGQFFGRDHSTVMASVKQIEKGILEKDQTVMEAVETASRIMATL